MTLVLLAASMALAQDHSVLMLGNSYTLYNDLPSLVTDTLAAGVPAWEEVEVLGLADGGLRLADHLARADGTEGDTGWREALVTGDTRWPHVVLQEQSQIPGFDETSADLQESWEAAAALDALIAAQGGETVLMLTWGRRDGDPQNEHIYPDFSAMQDRLTAGMLGYAERLSTAERPVWVLPAGLAFQTVHDDLVAAGVDPTDGDTAFTRLYSSDGSHPSLAGSTLAAATTLAALTGRSPVGLPGPGGLEDAELADLQDAAARTVLDDAWGPVAYPWAWTWQDWAAAAATPEVVDQGALRPWVQVHGEAISLTDLTVADGRVQVVTGGGLGAFGTVVVGSAGVGELWIDGGSALLGTLVVGSADGTGDVRLTDGTLALETAAWAGEGTLSVTGGELWIGSLTGDLVQDGGLLITGKAMTIDGSWTLGPDAGFLLEGPRGAVQVTGAAVLQGTFDVSLGAVGNEEEVVIVDAASVDADDLDAPAPSGWTLKVREGGLGQQLVLLPPPSDSGADDDRDTSDADPCGCTATAPAAAWIWLLVPWWRRRR